jgi:hypothetical protein
MLSLEQARAQVSLVAANFGNGAAFAEVLQDWFDFLGGKPGEVVIVDGGSKPDVQAIYWRLFGEGKIDKLQVIAPSHPENQKDLCFIQEHTAGAIAARPYLLWFKSDTLPFREGHQDWLGQALEYLDRPDTFAVGGSFNIPSKHHDAWPGWYFSDKCSENFALMKRSSFIAAMQEFAGDYIASGFREPNPAEATRQGRYLVEVAFERYIQSHQKYTLVKIEDSTWTVFHTNVEGQKLVDVRSNYLARIDVEKFMNARICNRVLGGCFYGRPPQRWTNFKWQLSESALGPLIRATKRVLSFPFSHPAETKGRQG